MANYKEQYMTFEILSSGYINWVKRNSSAPTVTIEYRINEGEWVSVTNTSTSGYRFNVVAGDKVEFRGTNSRYGGNYYNTFSGSTCQYNLYGNIMSMVNATDFENLTSFSNTYVFESMFRSTNVIDASSLLLPTTILTQACYQSMFVGCTSLIAAPELPATTLAIDCYNSMFNSCSNLTIAPTLPATTLTERCYYRMFEGCSKLNYVECLATSGIGQNNSTYIWVSGVASTGTFVKDPSASWSRGTSAVPNNWTIEDYNPFGPDTEELTFNANSGSTTITLESDGAWTATTSSDWIRLSQYSGETGGEITIYVLYNSFDERTGSIVFTDGENSATLTVIQSANTTAPIIKMFRNGRRIN